MARMASNSEAHQCCRKHLEFSPWFESCHPGSNSRRKSASYSRPDPRSDGAPSTFNICSRNCGASALEVGWWLGNHRGHQRCRGAMSNTLRGQSLAARQDCPALFTVNDLRIGVDEDGKAALCDADAKAYDVGVGHGPELIARRMRNYAPKMINGQPVLQPYRQATCRPA